MENTQNTSYDTPLDHAEKMTEEELKLLIQAFKRIEMKYRKFGAPLSINKDDADSALKTVGLTGIAEKLDTYVTFEDFLRDIKILTQVYSQHYEDEQSMVQEAKELKRECAHDVKSIRLCNECFDNWMKDRNGYFVKVCAKPHLLVMAKYDCHPYWPAKVMSVFGDKVNIEFFGDHTQADVSDSNCYLYRKPKKSANADLNEAVNEAEEHIRNVKEKFGSFVPAQKTRTNFYAGNLNVHLQTMFPDVYASTANDRSERLSSTESQENNVTLTDDHASTLDMPSLETPTSPVESSRKRRGSSAEGSVEAIPRKMSIEVISSEGDRNEEEEEEAASPAFSPLLRRALPKGEKIRRLEIELKVVNEQLAQAKAQIREQAQEMKKQPEVNEQLVQAKAQIREQAQEMKEQAKQILHLKEQVVEMGNGPECVNCGTVPKTLFFCSPECEKDYKQDFVAMSDSD
ncbi:MYND-type zinc finger-containing chromatin reader ZMYND8-like [Sitodiplosis mosellana]|uniref:MYND-type zinc finger-containing chromatin reader ZMYND8-like n=1 Tax=Sitodiplosis mosellana TaxID=263140 RepID=UPI002444A415|nr:MYND-type zinc finger-containing chromatin reader ZMYND8-like [Sitodiplosis mosellana]